MRSLAILVLALSAASAHADAPAQPAPAAVQTPAPTAVPTPLCTPAVTPDATFIDASYQYKWPHISLDEAKRLAAKKGTVFVDGRSQLEWDQSHIEGALAMPLGDFDKAYAKEGSKLKKAKVIVAYCHGKGCHLSDGLAQRLVDKGLHNVAVFWGGYPEWHDNHQPLVDKNGKRILDPTPVPAAK
jgi:rhodanese-related sulfurtransferase